VDLLLCGDWMSVTLIENEGEGVLNFLDEAAGFPAAKGFWRSLEFADLNADGRLDILAGNLGTNSLFQASAAEPVKLYLGDFDQNGSVDPLIFFKYFDRYVPLGSKDKYLSQLPGLKKRFVSYEDFAAVSSFTELLPDGEAQLVETKEVNELRSLLFLSGSEGYEAVPLPGPAQALTIQDFVVDANAGSITYLGSNRNLVAVRGNAMDTKMGKLTGFDPASRSFGGHRWLPVPPGVDGRSLVPLRDNQGIIVTNNSYPYLLDLR
jgi:hypothetical protein